MQLLTIAKIYQGEAHICALNIVIGIRLYVVVDWLLH